MGMVGKATLKLNYDSVGANTRVVYFSSIPPPPPKAPEYSHAQVLLSPSWWRTEANITGWYRRGGACCGDAITCSSLALPR